MFFFEESIEGQIRLPAVILGKTFKLDLLNFKHLPNIHKTEFIQAGVRCLVLLSEVDQGRLRHHSNYQLRKMYFPGERVYWSWSRLSQRTKMCTTEAVTVPVVIGTNKRHT